MLRIVRGIGSDIPTLEKGCMEPVKTTILLPKTAEAGGVGGAWLPQSPTVSTKSISTKSI